MSSHLATTEQAQLILKLYELRTEAVMREARAWAVGKFWPQSAEDVFAVLADMTLQENHYLRQVMGYWEMAASFVLHGALSSELFVDCNGEPIFLYAKFLPLLPAIRARAPEFLTKTGQLIESSSAANARVEQLTRTFAARRAAADS